MSLQTITFSNDKRIQSVITEGCLSVKALSLPAGESMKKHQTPHVLLLQCLEGKPSITVFGAAPDEQDVTTILTPGMLLRIEAKRPHEVNADEQNALLLLHLVNAE